MKDVTFSLGQKRDRKATMDGHYKIFKIKAKTKAIIYNQR